MAQSVSNLLQGNTANSTAKTRMKPVPGLVKPNALSFPALDSITSKMPQAGKAKLQSIQSAQAQKNDRIPGLNKPGALSFPYADSVNGGRNATSFATGQNGTTVVPSIPPAATAQPEQTTITPKPQLNIKQAPKSLFPSVLDSLRGKSAASKEQERLQRLAEQNALENKGFGRAARDISKKYATEIDRIGQLGAGAVAGNLSTGSNVVGSGNAAIASQSTSARMQALAEAQAAEMSGIDRSLTAQSQAQTGIGEALGSANTQQAQGISALGTAGNLAAPSVAGYGQTVFDPVTGQYQGGQPGLDPTNAAMQLANAVKSGQMTYEQAVQSLGYSGAGQQFLNQALGTGFNIPQSTATISGQADVIGQLPQLQAAEVAAEGIKDKVTTYLASNPQLNPSDAALVNQFNNWIQGKQLTDPKFQTLFTYLNEYTNTLAPILGVGGDPTNLKTEIAASFINPRAGAPSIVEVMNNLTTLSKGKLQDIQSGATGGGVVSSPQSFGTTGGGDALFDW